MCKGCGELSGECGGRQTCTALTGACSGGQRTPLHFPGLISQAKLEPNISRIECETNENENKYLIR